MSILHYALSFLLAIAVLVAIHECGHFLAARWCGVKVLRFSLGFGPVMFSRRFGKDETEFVLAAVPLGGYVRMLDEREAPVANGELARAFNTQSVGKRSLIVLAGPLANFLLAVLVYSCLAWAGTRDLPARLGAVPAATVAAQAGLREGDVVLRVDGRDVRGWSELRARLLQNALSEEVLVLDVQRGEAELTSLNLPLAGIEIDERAADPMLQLGLVLPPPRIPPVLSKPLPASPAARAGLLAGDRILAVNAQHIEIWAEFVERIASSAGKDVLLEVQRGESVTQLTVRPEAQAGSTRGRIGVAVQTDGIDLQRDSIEVRYGLFEGVFQAITQTWNTSRFSLEVMGHILTGRVSLRNISGPVTIADYAGQSASAGLDTYLRFLAMVSISLGVLNLLPVPILDGGHLLYYVIEYIRGKPLSARLEELGQRLGMIILALLMSLAFFNDLNRVFFG
ncbi:RIP metalloprotease RseP [Uliginosibacterium sp. TH139]|uniref:RIP metalloprotease RseP n=1 Tax=Uliginosibacterium sp. TH139 TaxID=2067453 RepID=UPI000C7A603F|nr:RIP metalloprotease RseP [Uliginosibacterium sp. TH139]PLK47717.1 RIP metalloprotease RseP [Uliginosibacterium sp. TH139]